MSAICESVTLRCFTDEPTVEFISEALQTPPTRVALKGERMSPKNPSSQIRSQSIWILESAVSGGESIDDHADSLLCHLERHASGFRNIASRLAAVDLNCYIHADGEQIGISLSETLIKRAGAFGVSLELDIYANVQDVNP